MHAAPMAPVNVLRAGGRIGTRGDVGEVGDDRVVCRIMEGLDTS
jgi:hypothetical protein